MGKSIKRWAPVAVLVAVSALVGWLALDWTGYVQSWGGALFRALSGGLIGWAISRYVVRLDLSAIDPDARPLAALSQAILIAGFAVALTPDA